MSPAGHLLKILLDIALESLTHRVLKMKTSSLTYDQIAHLTHSRLQQAFPRPQATQRILPQCRQKMLGIVRTSGLQAWEMNDEAFKAKGSDGVYIALASVAAYGPLGLFSFLD